MLRRGFGGELATTAPFSFIVTQVHALFKGRHRFPDTPFPLRVVGWLPLDKIPLLVVSACLLACCLAVLLSCCCATTGLQLRHTAPPPRPIGASVTNRNPPARRLSLLTGVGQICTELCEELKTSYLLPFYSRSYLELFFNFQPTRRLTANTSGHIPSTSSTRSFCTA